jgi:hypothetical protein
LSDEWGAQTAPHKDETKFSWHDRAPAPHNCVHFCPCPALQWKACPCPLALRPSFPLVESAALAHRTAPRSDPPEARPHFSLSLLSSSPFLARHHGSAVAYLPYCIASTSPFPSKVSLDTSIDISSFETKPCQAASASQRTRMSSSPYPAVTRRKRSKPTPFAFSRCATPSQGSCG